VDQLKTLVVRHRGNETSMKIQVDRDQCLGTGMCVREAPEVFALRGDGIVHLLIEEPGEGLRAEAEEAVRNCPVRALSLVEAPE
jgi:ferredoxin